MAKEILTMKNIVKEYVMGDEISRVLKGIDLTVEEGEFLAVLGPSGSGKSTLMNIIGCLDVPTSGEYILSGRKIADQDETALENVELPMIYANVKEKERKQRAMEVLEKVGLKDKMDHYPNQMSGGQQQRVAIARSIVNNPTILLADEPTGALDQKTGAQVMELFHELYDEGRCIIMITHDVHIAQHAKRIVRILDGNISEGVVEDA